MRKVQFLRGRSQSGIWTLALIAVLSTGSLAQASQLTIPGLAASDGLVVGNAVAYPFNAATALFHNPAQLSLLPNSFSTGSFNIMFHPSYENRQGLFNQLPGPAQGALGFRPDADRHGYYDSTSREFPTAPNFGYRTDRFAPFSFGIGMFGSLGFAFNHAAAPEHGIPNNFFTELVSVSLAPALSYSLASNLHIGASINPTYGRLKTKSPTPAGRLDLDVRGPGVFGSVGVMYQPTDRLNLGLTYKTPGKIWMFGNARVDGGGDDATVYFNIPQNVKFGFAYRVTDRLTVVGQARWSHLSVFDETRVRFKKYTLLNQPAVGRAKDRWRTGAGLTYQISENLMLGVGFTYEPWAIKDDALKPTLADNTDMMVAFGGQYKHGPWIFDVVGGMAPHVETRRADVGENPSFPGRYDLAMNVFGFQMTRLLGPSETDSEASGDAYSVSVASARDYGGFAGYAASRSARSSQSARSAQSAQLRRKSVPEHRLLADPDQSGQGEALLDTLIAKLSRQPERVILAQAAQDKAPVGEALLDRLIVQFSRNRCTLMPRSESGRLFALSDQERRQWCRRWDGLRPA